MSDAACPKDKWGDHRVSGAPLVEKPMCDRPLRTISLARERER